MTFELNFYNCLFLGSNLNKNHEKLKPSKNIELNLKYKCCYIILFVVYICLANLNLLLHLIFSRYYLEMTLNLQYFKNTLQKGYRNIQIRYDN